MLTRSGVKLLDFGLARLLEAEAPALGSHTRTALTQEGTIVGTLQYMAPEQLEGKPTDARTDLFAFGAILYEMVTGRRAFDAPARPGSSAPSCTRRCPPIASAPPAFARVLAACLAKKPEDRWSSAHDVRLLLQGIAAERGKRRRPVPTRSSRRQRAALGGSWRRWRWRRWPRCRRRHRVETAGTASTDVLSHRAAARHDASLAARRRRSRPMDARSPLSPPTAQDARCCTCAPRYVAGRAPVAGTDDATLPFWAPDSRRLGFFARSALKTVAVSPAGRRGPLRSRPCREAARGAKTTSSSLCRTRTAMPADPRRRGHGHAGERGQPRAAPAMVPLLSSRMDGTTCISPSISRARRGTAFASRSLDSAETREIVPSTVSATYAEPGFLLFRREAALVGAALRCRGAATRPAHPRPVADNVDYSPLGYQNFASASTGALVYQEPDPGWHLTWFDRAGRRLGAAVPGGRPIQRPVPVARRRPTRVRPGRCRSAHRPTMDLWSLELATWRDDAADLRSVRGLLSGVRADRRRDRLCFVARRAAEPVPAGRHGARQRNGAAADTEGRRSRPIGHVTDGSSSTRPSTRRRLGHLDAAAVGRAAVPLCRHAGRGAQRQDVAGRPLLAYTFVQGDKSDVYVPAVSGDRREVADFPRRRAAPRLERGRPGRCFTSSADKKIMAVEVSSAGGRVCVGQPRIAVDARIEASERTNQGSPFGVTPDGSASS